MSMCQGNSRVPLFACVLVLQESAKYITSDIILLALNLFPLLFQFCDSVICSYIVTKIHRKETHKCELSVRFARHY